jgi:ribosomal protein L7Ae-like RNA K-turn-binding protein
VGTPSEGPGYGTHEAVAIRRLLELLGLASRAGALVAGTEAVKIGVKEGSIRRVILANDTAPTQKKKLEPLLQARGVPFHVIFSQVELGAATGKNPVAAIGLGEANFARRAGELLASIPKRRGAARPSGSSQQE